ncbi:hypothetical protein EX895_003167 [Sporisorium graminicola]|uniref:Zn(2)-C6 fungal-type domain-containing protein n=1 Tax=Sporisorium graminicola TaxID=280036 RepID=A0A4U7KU44_9BASI|nr:hypothetical protein EX895_003167 [Sporisorium graminicola]TKY88071.1 hypothetical protein EX895_003167 [Sporisorium graminicola]
MPADRNAQQQHHPHRHDELAAVDAKIPPKQTARRRAYAKRSCLKCREKKARCELPDESLNVPSSMTPLTNDLACHRCKVLSLDCVVWDGDRKRRPRVSSPGSALEGNLGKWPSTITSTTVKAEPSSSRLPSSPPRSPGSLEQLAAAAARLSDQRSAYHDAPDLSPHAATSSNDAASSREAASTLASVQFFNPVPDDVVTPHSASSTPSARGHERSSMHASSLSTHYKPPAPGSAPSPNNSATSIPSMSAKVQPPGRTWTSLWRPLSVLIDYAAQQPSFTTYLVSRIDRNLTDLDILNLIPRSTLSYLKPFLKPYLLWHPHLPGLDQMYAAHRRRPTISSALLLSSLCLVSCRHAMPLSDPLAVQLSTLVDQLGTQILLSTPRDMYTVQALELLLAHEPSLVGTSVAGSAQAERGNGLLGESLLAAALTIARGLDLDKAIDSVVDLCRRPGPTDPKQAQQRRDLLDKHLAGASLWQSLSIWEGHFSFVNSTVRPIQLNDLTAKAEAMVAIDNEGRKIERLHRDPFQSIESRFPGLDEDSVLRSAGRTGLVYRLQAMARFHDTIAGMYRILATATKPELDPPASLMPTTPETRQQILDLLSSSSQQQLLWQAAKAQAFSPFASVRPALLLEDWATIESYSLQELLPCLAICAFMTGELNHGFSANEMVDALRFDSSFTKHGAIISERRDTETHSLLSVFSLFDRGLGYSQPDILTRGGPAAQSKKQRGSLWIEATGAPLLLTTAFVTDGCKTFLEKTACSLHGFDFLPVTVDMHMSMMINALHRLDECDRNEYLPPLRPKRSSMPPPPAGRRLPSLPPDLTDPKDQATPGKSISQIGVLFIEEMVQVMQKWKLGASLQRAMPLQFRHLLTKASAPASSADGQSQPVSTDTSAMPADVQPSPKPSTQQSHQPDPTMHQDHQAASNHFAPNPSSNTAAINFSDYQAHQGQTASFPQSFQHSFVSGLPQQQQQPPNLTAPSGGGHGGMFDIPMFDLFGSASTTDWANNVPWFDPVDNGASAPAALSLPSFGNGHATSQWGQYSQQQPFPPQPSLPSPLQNTWPAPQRKRSSDTLPPLQYTSAPTTQANTVYNADYGSYSGYPLPTSSSAAGLGSVYGEQSDSALGQTQPQSISSNGAHHHHYRHQQQHHAFQQPPQQPPQQQPPPHRAHYNGDHHGGR